MADDHEGIPILTETSVTEDTYSVSFYMKGKNGFSLTYDSNVGSGNLVATLKLQCRNSSSETFRDVNNAAFPTSPNGSAKLDEKTVTGSYHTEYRVMVDYTSGDGPINMRLYKSEN